MKEEKEDEIKEELSESGEKIGIEAENDEDHMEPFNPEEISIQQKVIPMDVIIRRLKQGSIQLSPSFQRKEVWDITRKSRLIESLMLNIPLPMFYVAADEEGNWEVVDGLQRLSTIRDFIIGDKNGVLLRLKNLEFLNDKFEGKTFKAIEVDPSAQKLVNDIYETEMRFTVINPGTPEAVKRNIFKRINTGGMPLTAQEIRHALYEGESSKLLQRLVQNIYFKQAVGKKLDDSRMGASELILRMLSFMILDRGYYKQGMDNWLSNMMRLINLYPNPEDCEVKKIFQINENIKLKVKSIDDVVNRFEVSMKRAEKLFDGHAFRKSLPGDYRKSPINKSLFEVWGNILSELKVDEFDKLDKNKNILITNYQRLLFDTDFNNAISRHSSTQKGVLDSYREIKEIVNSCINEGVQ
ncbi:MULTISPECIES: DUF262 domain-containing protein [Citrobacter]|uniref:DUF262 domain-containing protein n=1 Tax=Citrobacter TaxID=544 RepID=UPI000F66FBF0|nr:MULTISPECIES: DUF262 domain-containing protein [Citrobacter]MDM2872068.1 DUF262 domain-containing protein [Citrobacter sp. Cpo069]NUH54657.1 DUF262 domain-containing protein [Citrobacter portucalensis]QXR23366.1 DUF262 domain-containing protein [Citrobacter freundii]